jgi:hypothetical protein
MSSNWPSQNRVLDLMAQGWALGHSTDNTSYTWLQRGDVGRGGESLTVHGNTFYALRSKGLIRSKDGYHFPTEEYVLTDKVDDG